MNNLLKTKLKQFVLVVLCHTVFNNLSFCVYILIGYDLIVKCFKMLK